MKTTCVLAIITDEKRILLAMKKRGFGSGYWNGPGGKVEEGEAVEAALIRECHEEVGITITKFEKVALHDFKFPDGRSDMVVHTFRCTQWEGEPMESDEMAPQWFDQTEIPYDRMWADDRYWLPLVLAGKKLSTEFTFDHEQNMLAYAVNEVEKLA
jgi:mutator protein MutT